MSEVKGVRYIEIDDKEIYKLLSQKEKLIIELREMQEKINKLGEDGEKKGMQVQKIKDKALPKMQPYVDDEDLVRNIEFGCPNCRWEVVTQFLTEEGGLKMEVVDLIDQEKQRILEKFKNEDEDKTGNPDQGAAPLQDGVDDSAVAEEK